jgi:thiol-disulfide isomerase/thioredoxin
MRALARNGLLLAAALAALGAGYFASRWLHHPQIEETGVALVEFSLPDLDGRHRWLSEWQGRVIVLNFWATWCPPCREEIPLFISLQQRYGERGLQILGVAIDSKQEVLSYSHSLGINYPLLLGEEAGLSIMSRYGNRMGSLPYSVVFSREGRVVARKLGMFRGKELEEFIIPLISPD